MGEAVRRRAFARDQSESHPLIQLLRDERLEQNIYQRELAQRMGVSQSRVNQLERGAHDARLSTVEAYAKALGYSLEYTIVPLDE